MSILIVEKEKRKFSPDWLRNFQGFENYTDEKAVKEIKELETLSEIICQHIQNTS